VFDPETAASFIRAWFGPRRRNSALGYIQNERFEIKSIEHQEAYSLDGARADLAEEYFFSRHWRAGIWLHRAIAGA
jgi:hypothetical protein